LTNIKPNASSVKDRLLNKSRETGKTFQEYLILYGLERTIYRISISHYANYFTLKGGIFLYALFSGDYARSTIDIDFLARNIENDLDNMKSIFTEIFSIPANDPIVFDLDSLSIKSITEFKKYHGVNISIMGYLDKTKLPVSIDIGFDDIIYPGRVEMDFPVVLGNDAPHIYAYSIYSCIAEKFEAIVSLGYDNSRFKDFYDIYIIATTNSLIGNELKNAVYETFSHRGTDINDIVAFEDDFCKDTIRISRWNSFVKKKQAMVDISLEDTIKTVKDLLIPIADSLNNNTEFYLTWDPSGMYRTK